MRRCIASVFYCLSETIRLDFLAMRNSNPMHFMVRCFVVMTVGISLSVVAVGAALLWYGVQNVVREMPR